MKTIKTLILILLSFVAFSQSKFQVGAESGVGIGFLYKNSYNIPSAEFSGIVALSNGLNFQYNFNKTFSFKTGFYLDRKGYTYTAYLVQNFGTPYEVRFYRAYNYLSIPLLIKASTGKKTRFFINCGPSFDFITFGKHYGKVLYNKEKTEKKSTDLFGSNKFNIGLITGLGVEIPIKEKFSTSIEIRDNISFKDIWSSSNNKLNTVNLLLGFSYKFGKNKNNAENN